MSSILREEMASDFAEVASEFGAELKFAGLRTGVRCTLSETTLEADAETGGFFAGTVYVAHALRADVPAEVVPGTFAEYGGLRLEVLRVSGRREGAVCEITLMKRS